VIPTFISGCLPCHARTGPKSFLLTAIDSAVEYREFQSINDFHEQFEMQGEALKFGITAAKAWVDDHPLASDRPAKSFLPKLIRRTKAIRAS
jgi:hypothetical protein